MSMQFKLYWYNCQNAYIFLQITWRFNILSAVYLCRDLKFGLKLYTHNPYSKSASKFWIKNATYVEKNGELFTLFVNAEQEVDRSLMCQEIWFDKTQDLSEYPVRVALSNLTYDSTIDESTGKFVKVEAYKTGRQYMSIIWKKLNARMYSVEYFLEEDFGEIDGDGIASGIIGDVLHGKFEALGSEDYQRGLWKLESQLSAMLATDTSYRDPETDIYDLLNMGYDIRINSVIEEAYRHFPFPSKNHFFDNLLECLRLMKTNNMIACIEDCTLIKYVMQQSEEVDILYDKDYDRNDIGYITKEQALPKLWDYRWSD
ncbi:PREDICTED: uncharacterized protein LOC105364966 [Ceratosolen solmsi marchali]|uniref:Uncharacterized protein LOC105364966 n=1 Tax=Ceratosolen solmsi marchali TaxID=326594 RepID=A0AAJ7DYQ3_9HYME|nr:PREDICTED: uncharacterized protein LOC105364966 [Ceratosolen solmsi marchali]